jgi:hypothetical protein
MDDFFATLSPWWPPGRADLHWHLLPDPAQLATELIEPCRELTHRPGLAPVQPRWGHITVQDIAPADDVTPREVDLIVARVQRAAPREVTGGRFPTRPATCRPHLSLAYGVSRGRDERLHDWLAAHPVRTMTFTANQLALVAQSHGGAGAITWRPVTTVPLTGSA